MMSSFQQDSGDGILSTLALLKGQVVVIAVVRSELIQISSRLITQTAAKTDKKVTNSQGKMFLLIL